MVLNTLYKCTTCARDACITSTCKCSCHKLKLEPKEQLWKGFDDEEMPH